MMQGPGMKGHEHHVRRTWAFGSGLAGVRVEFLVWLSWLRLFLPTPNTWLSV